jgi:peptidoglycan/xylan/chitin deacetylase (PgdA/CDA1 family)
MQFAPIYPVLHYVLSPLFPTCLWCGDANTKTIALSFDDGPHPHHTLPLLDALDRHDIRANFFWLGGCVERSPEVAREACERGHWMGLHGYTHQLFPRLTPDELKRSLERTQDAIAHACGLEPELVRSQVRDVRPPVGVFTPRTLDYLHQWGYRPVMWSVVPEDWVRPGIEVAVQRVLNQTRNGSLIVLHDGYYGGEDVVAIVDRLIPQLIDQGYDFVSVNDLWTKHAHVGISP